MIESSHIAALDDKTNSIASSLAKTGVGICPDYLTPQELVELRSDLDSIYASGGFRRAAVGQGRQGLVRDTVRRDEVHWLDHQAKTKAQEKLWTKLESLKTAFNRQTFLGLRSFEGHYAVYPSGGFYSKHKDSLNLNNNRIVSLILYLNLNWQREDGGCLRMHGEHNQEDIEPIGGKLVCFLSEEVEHEVCLSLQTRSSFTGWFKS